MALVMPDGNPQPMSQSTYQSKPAYGNAWGQLGDTYKQYLGREMGDADFASQTNNGRDYQQKNIDYARNNIMNSPEAQAYAKSRETAQAPPSVDQAPPPPAQQYAPPTSGGQGQPAPGVPATYAGPNASGMAQQSMQAAPTIQSQYNPQQIRDFTGKQLNVPDYTKTVFSQFSDPRNMQVQGAKDQQLLKLIQNPQSLNQTWQDQMFEAQKDDATAFAKQMGLQNQQGMVGRGFNPMGNQAQWQQQELQGQLGNQLLAGRRDVATKAALQNRADELNALQAAEAGLSGDTSRMSQIFQNILSGQQAQAGDNQFAARYGLDATQAQAANERDNYAAYLSGRNVQGAENRAAEQFRQSAFGLSNQSQQNARSSGLQEWLAQNNSDLGWANYGLNADDQFLRYLSGQ